MSFQIIPKYKLLLTYDVLPDTQDRYYRYVLGEFAPAVQQMGLYMDWAWHTAYGDYPMRRLEFVTDSWETVERVFHDEKWTELEDRLKSYTTNYSRKLLRYRRGFQI